MNLHKTLEECIEGQEEDRRDIDILKTIVCEMRKKDEVNKEKEESLCEMCNAEKMHADAFVVGKPQ